MADKLIYLRIEEEIRKRIVSGVYPPGSQLPTEKELVEEFGASRLTIGKSLTQLVAENMITRTRGRGSFVTTPEFRAAPDKPPSEPGILKFISPPATAGDEVLERNGLLEGMRSAVHAAGYSVGVDFFSSIGEELTLLREYTRPLNDGFVVWPTNDAGTLNQLKELQREKFPFVQVDNFFAELNGDYVLTDNTIGAQAMIRHLYGLGHRRIAYLTVPVDRISLSERFSGAISALARLGLTIDGHLGMIPSSEEVNLQNIKEQQYEFISQWISARLQMPDRPTAVFCSNDTLAITLLNILAEKKVSVPDDISVAGFDNINISAWLPTPLTTVAHNFNRIGLLAGQTLLRRLREPDSLPTQYRVPPELVVRKSTGPVAG